MARSALMTVMIQAVRKVGRNLTRDYGEVENLQVSLKGPGQFVTAADRKAETALFEELQRVRPAFGYRSEARGEVQGTDASQRWVAEPVDGVTNLLHGMPHFAISVALEKAGQIIAGVVYNPATDEIFSTERGGGAFLNDRRLRVAVRKELADAVIGTALPDLAGGDHRRHAAELRQIAASVAGVRALGCTSLDLAYVAAGRLDGAWLTGLAPWKAAAGVLMIKEAGGYATTFDGADKALATGEVVCGNEDIHGALMRKIAAAA
ncbi:inositol monophosphatase family protein [Methylobrevis pamukkalensis]|uniref:Inositol-1-monophosphatase n=1 Tax=Methylobrevis pamukkalensis TaxID=1439726 RepID=A0A1E3H126_9HYPH|nr:inositol monophosphatase family protein [Methylobrevis pamukkalensis]ODN70038.1 Inositol-1-monophosphatase [Methylobrevis pamukkalensis]